jgi:formylglycine-generating enzyme required for sulfatase activity
MKPKIAFLVICLVVFFTAILRIPKGKEANAGLLLRGQSTEAEERLASAAPSAGTVRENSKDGLKYVWIPPGSFMMGCSPGGDRCWKWDTPSHVVAITRGFWMGQKPVTMEAYKRFADATGRDVSVVAGWQDFANGNSPVVHRAREINPISGVTWEEAHAYCEWIGGRLPTEAEWEYAARGGGAELRYEPIDKLKLCGPENGGKIFDPPCQQINGFGLIDMLGNVPQWVNDVYDETYYQTSPREDPPGPMSGQKRGMRGGCHLINTKLVHVWDRIGFDPARRTVSTGLRCVRDGENP